jgi:hypothetical protein
VEQLKCLLTVIFIAEPLEQNVKEKTLGVQPSSGIHRSTMPMASLVLLTAQRGPEQMGEYNGIHHPTYLEDSTKGGEAMVQAAHLAVATDDDTIGV